MATRLRGLLAEFSDRLPVDSADALAFFVNHNELGVALENMTHALEESRSPISLAQRDEMLSLAASMELDEPVLALIASLPTVA